MLYYITLLVLIAGALNRSVQSISKAAISMRVSLGRILSIVYFTFMAEHMSRPSRIFI
ncbi:hypothetical protein [Maribacter sp. ACAM166]|uniref:hypothetical protein n=1 Tax=Maribacter sp. ACAM166 TaxID=2508996 RepID=UPI001485B675|nr:hypothetical protein [Maribacter sp. ACAM166]